MNVMNRYVIPVFFETDESQSKFKMGLESNILEDSIIRDIIFYRIDAIGDYYSDEKLVGTQIFIVGDIFLSPLKKETIDNMINK